MIKYKGGICVKKWLTGILLTTLFTVCFGMNASAEELTSVGPIAKMEYIPAGGKLSLEDDKTFVLANGVSVTANKVEDSSVDSFGILATLPPPNSQWDYIGYSNFKKESAVFHSTGGDIRIDIWLDPDPNNFFSNPYVIQLREQDTYTSWNVAQIEIHDSSRWELSVRGLNDGDNNLSELFLRKLTYTGDYTYTEWYD